MEMRERLQSFLACPFDPVDPEINRGAGSKSLRLRNHIIAKKPDKMRLKPIGEIPRYMRRRTTEVGTGEVARLNFV